MSSNEKFSRIMSPAHIREPGGIDYAEVIFLESARFFRLNKENPEFDSIVALLRDASEKKLMLEIFFESSASNTIEEVKPVM